jgi:Sulfotransferase family
MNPFVFLVGCPRSGTTLLRRVADAHPLLAVARGTRWIARTFELRRGLTEDGHVTPKLLERLRRDPFRLERLELREEDLERMSARSEPIAFADFVTELYDLYGDRHGKLLVGDKTPGYVRYLPTLHDLWPSARFVHIVRDGRDVCLSVLDWRKDATGFCTFGRDPVTTIAVWWEWYVRLGLEGAGELEPDLYHELRYESLVESPERECRRLARFLGLPYDDAMLRFHEGRTRDDPELDAKRAWKPITPGLRSWRTQLPHADVVRFEAAAGELLEELGYERATSSVPRSELARAERVRKTFMSEVRARGRPLPRAWSPETVAAVP